MTIKWLTLGSLLCLLTTGCAVYDPGYRTHGSVYYSYGGAYYDHCPPGTAPVWGSYSCRIVNPGVAYGRGWVAPGYGYQGYPGYPNNNHNDHHDDGHGNGHGSSGGWSQPPPQGGGYPGNGGQPQNPPGHGNPGSPPQEHKPTVSELMPYVSGQKQPPSSHPSGQPQQGHVTTTSPKPAVSRPAPARSPQAAATANYHGHLGGAVAPQARKATQKPKPVARQSDNKRPLPQP